MTHIYHFINILKLPLNTFDVSDKMTKNKRKHAYAVFVLKMLQNTAHHPTTYRPYQIKSNQIKSNQIKSNQIKSNQIKFICTTISIVSAKSHAFT